jgi:hypothetical protein
MRAWRLLSRRLAAIASTAVTSGEADRGAGEQREQCGTPSNLRHTERVRQNQGDAKVGFSGSVDEVDQRVAESIDHEDGVLAGLTLRLVRRWGWPGGDSG